VERDVPAAAEADGVDVYGEERGEELMFGLLEREAIEFDAIRHGGIPFCLRIVRTVYHPGRG
jgi:hypothetical protein